MVTWNIDETTIRKLLSCLEELELCDEAGQVLARLTPDPAYREKMYAPVRERFANSVAGEEPSEDSDLTLVEILEQAHSIKRAGGSNGAVQARLDETSGSPIG